VRTTGGGGGGEGEGEGGGGEGGGDNQHIEQLNAHWLLYGSLLQFRTLSWIVPTCSLQKLAPAESSHGGGGGDGDGGGGTEAAIVDVTHASKIATRMSILP
jgi:hypothetical protein